MTKTLIRWVVIGLLAVAVVALVVFLFWPRPVEVDVAAVRRGPIADVVADQGTARVRQAYVVSSPVGGQLERVNLEVGDRVVADRTIVARIRPAAPEFLDPRVARSSGSRGGSGALGTSIRDGAARQARGRCRPRA